MKHYIVKESYLDNFGTDYTPFSLIDETTLFDLADAWEMSREDILDMVIEASEKTVYIAREANAYEDVYKAYFNRNDAVDAAKMYLAHLTASERETNTVSVERYTVVCAAAMTAENAFSTAIEYDLVGDPEEYEVIE